GAVLAGERAGSERLVGEAARAAARPAALALEVRRALLSGAVGVSAVLHPVAVVVGAVLAGEGARAERLVHDAAGATARFVRLTLGVRAALGAEAVGIGAVDEPVAVVVGSVLAGVGAAGGEELVGDAAGTGAAGVRLALLVHGALLAGAVGIG